MIELDMICEHLAMNKNMNPNYIVMGIIEKCEVLHARMLRMYNLLQFMMWGSSYEDVNCKYIYEGLLRVSVKNALLITKN